MKILTNFSLRAEGSSDSQAGWLEEKSSPADLLRPFEYALNLTVPANPPSMHAQLSILAELGQTSSQLILYYGREAGKLLEKEVIFGDNLVQLIPSLPSQVRVWLCQSGRQRKAMLNPSKNKSLAIPKANLCASVL